jgi:hypothetical protein
VRAALATLPWVEQGTIKMDFKNRKLTFGFKEKKDYNPQAVIEALETTGRFKDVEELEHQ